MTTRRVLSILCLVAAAAGAACGATPSKTPDGGDDDMPPDAPAQITCSDLMCGANASCAMTGGAAACACNPGFTGDGATCHDVDECAMANAGCPVGCENTPGSFRCYAPATCAEIKAHAPAAVDGDYTLYVGGDAGRPWRAYCARMATAPAEYLSLIGTNAGQYIAGPTTPGTDVTTKYSKVRFDPVSLRIDIRDRAFADSQGALNHGGTTVTSMPFGVAMDCRGPSSKLGFAAIDLTGTAFTLGASPAYIAGGDHPGSALQLSSDNRRARINGGGSCGWYAPTGTPANPFNDNVTDGLLLKVQYLP